MRIAGNTVRSKHASISLLSIFAAAASSQAQDQTAQRHTVEAQQAELEHGKAVVVKEARNLAERATAMRDLEATVLAAEARLKEAQRDHEAAMQRHEADLLRRVARQEEEEERLKESSVQAAAAEAACKVREGNLSQQAITAKEKAAALELRALEVAQAQDHVKQEHAKLGEERKEYHAQKKAFGERQSRVEQREKLVTEKEEAARELERKAGLREERAEKAKAEAIEARSQLKLEEARMEVLRGQISSKQRECDAAVAKREEKEAAIDADLRAVRKERGEVDLALLKLEQANRDRLNVVMVNVDNPRWQDLVDRYEVNGIPQLNLFSADGTAVGRSIGLRREEELTALADALIEGRSFPSLQGLGPVTPRSDFMPAQAAINAGPRSHSQAG